MMTVKEYAAKIGVPVSTIRQMCADAVLPSVKVGVGYRIFEDKADAYFEQQWEERRAHKENAGRLTARLSPVKRQQPACRTSGNDFIAKLKAMQDGLVGSGGAGA